MVFPEPWQKKLSRLAGDAPEPSPTPVPTESNILSVTIDSNNVADKTWKECYDAYVAGKLVIFKDHSYTSGLYTIYRTHIMLSIYTDDENYRCDVLMSDNGSHTAFVWTAFADGENGYIDFND